MRSIDSHMRRREPASKTRGRTLNYAAPVYDFVVDTLSLGVDGKARQRLLDIEGFADCDRVLDVGCATGTLTVQIAERLRGRGCVVGVDAAPRMIDVASRKAGDLPVRFEVQLAEDLTFPDESFDRVVNTMFLHHMPLDLKERALAEMVRVLEPGGRILTVDIDRPTTFVGAVVGYGSFVLLVQKPIYENLRGILPELMRAAGVADVQRLDHRYGLVSFFVGVKP